MKVLIGKRKYDMPIHLWMGRFTVADLESIKGQSLATISAWLDSLEEPGVSQLTGKPLKRRPPSKHRYSLKENLLTARPDIFHDGQILDDDLFYRVAYVCASAGADLLLMDKRIDPASLLEFQKRRFHHDLEHGKTDYFEVVNVLLSDGGECSAQDFSPWVDCQSPLAERFFTALDPHDKQSYLDDLCRKKQLFTIAALHMAIIAAGPDYVDLVVDGLTNYGYADFAEDLATIAENSTKPQLT